MKPLTLVINQNNTTHKLELAKAVTFSNQATRRRLTEIESNDAKQDERLTAVEDKDSAQDKKITDLEAEIADLKAAQATIRDQIVEIRYFQSADKPTGLPPGPATAIYTGKMTVGHGEEIVDIPDIYKATQSYFGFIEDGDDGLGSLTNKTFNLNGTDYQIQGIYTKRQVEVVSGEINSDASVSYFGFSEVGNVNGRPFIRAAVFDDICIRVGKTAYVLSEKDGFISDTNYYKSNIFYRKTVGINFYFNNVNLLTADDVGSEIDIAIEPLEWTTTIPPFVKEIDGKPTKLYMAFKVGGAWQVVRVNHPDQ